MTKTKLTLGHAPFFKFQELVNFCDTFVNSLELADLTTEELAAGIPALTLEKLLLLNHSQGRKVHCKIL